MGADPAATDRRAAPRHRQGRLHRIAQVAAAVGIVLATGLACAPPHPRRAPPNIVLVVMDTTRADRCSVNGYGRPTTPRLEALAAEGATFLQCWSPTSWTVPAHASLFTGLRPEHHGVMHGNRRYLAPETVTLAQRFAGHGYATACFTNNPNLHIAQLTRGFETVRELWVRRSVSTAFGGGPRVAVEDLRHRTAADTYELALAWARSQQAAGRPFFLFVNVMEPHLTYDPPAQAGEAILPAPGADRSPEDEQWARKFKFPECIGASLRAVPVSPVRRRLLSDLYDAEIAAADEGLATLVDGLRAMGVYDETALVVTADHGENLGDHGLYDHVLSLNASLRRVPLVIRYPEAFEAGARVQDVVRLEDLFPTLLELGGQRVPADIDALSLLRDLEGRVAYAALGDRMFMTGYLHAAFPDADLQRATLSWRAVFDGRHHLIRDSRGNYTLHDVLEDPGETRDLSLKEPHTLDRMIRTLERAYPAAPTIR